MDLKGVKNTTENIEALNNFEKDLLKVIKKHSEKIEDDDKLYWRYQQVMHKVFDTGR